MTIQTYSPEIEAQLPDFHINLSKKNRRRYTAIETSELGHGGASYMRRLFSCNDRTIRQGQQELGAGISGEAHEAQRIRKIDGGRKPILATAEGLDDAFLRLSLIKILKLVVK